MLSFILKRVEKIAIYFFVFCLLLQYSCTEENQISDNDIQSVTDNIIADNAIQNIFLTVNEYALSYLSSKGTNIDSNSIVSISPLYPLDSFPKTMIIDYCNGICCVDGKTRKGKVIAILNNKWIIDSTSSNLMAEVTTNDFFENNVQLMGTFKINVNGIIDSFPSFSISTLDAKLILENGKSTQWTSNKNIKWISGFQTINNINDDVFLITGSNTGINCNGMGYESDIISPLLYEKSCQNGIITKGKLELIPQDVSKRIIDFGNGDCDRKASVTINGVTVEIDL
jgi:hypothetical protein